MSQDTPEEILLTPVYRAPNEGVADIVRALLDSEGIQVIFRSNHTHSVYDGIFAAGDGYWADLMVREDEADQAREIIKAFENKETA